MDQPLFEPGLSGRLNQAGLNAGMEKHFDFLFATFYIALQEMHFASWPVRENTTDVVARLRW